MYRRYSRGGEEIGPRPRSHWNRIKSILIILLLAALLALSFFAIPAFRNQGEIRTLFVQRVQSECDEALRQTSTLSHNAGRDSAAILARIRSCVYVIRTANELCAASGNGSLLPDDELLALQDEVDRYLTFITTGMDTSEYQTNLQNDLSALQERVTSLE